MGAEHGILVALIAVFAYVTVLFAISLILRRNDIADVGWGMGVLLSGVAPLVYGGVYGSHALLVLFLEAVWAVRLSTRIFLRNRRKGEDYRYRAWRESWGKWFYVRSFFQIYLLQGLLMVVVGYPLIHASGVGNVPLLHPLVALGVLVWAVGFFFEVVGDYELDSFVRNPENKEKLLTTGLWRYSRHPNYFGEVTMWWGVWLIILSLPMGFVALVSPLMITLLILRVSGIPMLEAKLGEHPEWGAYVARTSAFVPLPPRRP